MPHQIPANDPSSPSGLLIALSHTLDRSNPLARSARKTARRLAHCQRPPAWLLLETAEITARLLDAADDTLPARGFRPARFGLGRSLKTRPARTFSSRQCRRRRSEKPVT